MAVLKYFARIEESADKVLYGSDWPSPGVKSMAANVRDFRELGLSQAALEKILDSNSRRVFG
jgi:predicted TIM-barrel fold metal-dependent hydrolase